MTIVDLKDYLLINSLQYFVGADDIEVTDEILEGLIKRAISVYSNWRPLFVENNIEIRKNVTYMKQDEKGRNILNITNLYYYLPIMMGEQQAIDWNWDWDRSSGMLRTIITGKFVAEMLIQPKFEDMTESDHEFLEMVLGLYMMYVGSSRKAFSFGDQPFENDGTDIHSDGKELYENTVEALKSEQDNWYLSIL